MKIDMPLANSSTELLTHKIKIALNFKDTK